MLCHKIYYKLLIVDVLNLKLRDLEEKGEAIPTATGPRKIKTAKNDFIFQVSADTVAYRKLYDK